MSERSSTGQLSWEGQGGLVRGCSDRECRVDVGADERRGAYDQVFYFPSVAGSIFSLDPLWCCFCTYLMNLPITI